MPHGRLVYFFTRRSTPSTALKRKRKEKVRTVQQAKCLAGEEPDRAVRWANCSIMVGAVEIVRRRQLRSNRGGCFEYSSGGCALFCSDESWARLEGRPHLVRQYAWCTLQAQLESLTSDRCFHILRTDVGRVLHPNADSRSRFRPRGGHIDALPCVRLYRVHRLW